MVMMHSPKSDSGHPGSPVSINENNRDENSSPVLPNSHQMSNTVAMPIPTKNGNKIQEISHPIPINPLVTRFSSELQDSQDQKPLTSHFELKNNKITIISPSNKENTNIRVLPPSSLTVIGDSHHHILYPDPHHHHHANEPSAKFSIERLKQLADHNITRVSPTDDNKYSIDHTKDLQGPPSTTTTTSHSQQQPPSQILQTQAITASTIISPVSTILTPSLGNALVPPHQFGLKYLAGHPDIMDIERFRLARAAMSNGKDLTDFGFRIQLGGLPANYARSDTSEELNVDGDGDSSQDGNSTCPVDLTPNKFNNSHHANSNGTNNRLHHHHNNNNHHHSSSSDTESEIPPKRLAFSVENILDPNKFTGKNKLNFTENHNNNRIWNGFEMRDDMSRDRYDDDQSESRSGKRIFLYF
uniref:CSON014504 protein n=1 Tax=Culicoides sonorensis TaxID=179676 RepID=A0A336KSY1_CULSO